MNRPTPRTARRIPAAVLHAALPAALLAVLLAALLVVPQAPAAAWPATGRDAGRAVPPVAATPSPADRTLPHLKFVCPEAIGDHKFSGFLPDGPLQEQCFYSDGKGSEFTVGASWVTRPNQPGDPYAVCVAPTRTAWHDEDSTGGHLARFSVTRRAHAYAALDLYWPNKDKRARQRAMSAQIQAVGDQLLAVAEKLAQPCVEPTPTPSPSSSGTTEPTESPSSTTTEPSPSPTTQQSAPCEALDGRLTDNDGRPVPGVVVLLEVPGREPVDTGTDDQGNFHFGELPDTGQAAASDAARLRVLVRDGMGLWRVHAGEKEASLLTERFALTESTGCRHDLTTSSLDGYDTANPATVGRWADLWEIVGKTRRALAYIDTTLDVTLHDVPVVIHAWCPRSLQGRMCAPNARTPFASERRPTDAEQSSGVGVTGRVPYVALPSTRADQESEAPAADSMYHEFGHILQADLAGSLSRLGAPGRTNHGGYANASSNDSWTEGFASWFAMSLRQADGRRSSFYQWTDGSRRDVENDVKAWDANGKDEEWAVAGLLADLTDRAGTSGDLGRPVPFTMTGTGSARLIRGDAGAAAVLAGNAVVVELYDPTGKRIGSEDAFVLPNGQFFSVPAAGFARALAFVRPSRGGTGRQDDDPFAMPARNVIRLITGPPNAGTRGDRVNRSAVVFDMAELHSVMLRRLGRARAADVDALFVAHGFHENLKNANRYVRGAAVGMTTHEPFDPDFDPRYDTPVLPARYVTVDTGGRKATVLVFPKNGLPYGVTPDASGRVPVMIPGSLDSRAAVVTLAEGTRPAVTVIEGKSFWPKAAAQDAPFLTIQPELVPTATATPASRPNWLLAVGSGVALLAFGAGATLLGLSRRRRHRPVPPTGG